MEVAELSKQLGYGFTDKQRAYLSLSVFGFNRSDKDGHKFYHLKCGLGWCTHCGHWFKVGRDEKAICPECGAHLQSVESIMETGWDKRGKCDYFLSDILRKWYNVKTGLVVTERVPVVMCANWVDQPYALYCDMRIAKSETTWTREWFRFYVCPHGKIHPELRRRGFSIPAMRKMEYISDTIKTVFAIPYAETLLKARQYRLLREITKNADEFDKYKDSIRIALKHGISFFRINVKDYMDYLSQLKSLHYDLRSPKWLVPANFYAEHDRLGVLLCRKEKMQRFEKENALWGEKYAKRMTRFASLVIAGEEVEIRPLMSVQEVFEEGLHMHHCVFDCVYYQKDNVLLLSAKVNGGRVETIELNMRDWTIVQSRGLQNATTPYHKTILGLLKRDMGKIRRLAKAS